MKKLRQVQTVLGELNDAASTAALLTEKVGEDEVRQLLEYLDLESRKKRREFRRLWKDGMDGSG